jgi:hypothetical protein
MFIYIYINTYIYTYKKQRKGKKRGKQISSPHLFPSARPTLLHVDARVAARAA